MLFLVQLDDINLHSYIPAFLTETSARGCGEYLHCTATLTASRLTTHNTLYFSSI